MFLLTLTSLYTSSSTPRTPKLSATPAGRAPNIPSASNRDYNSEVAPALAEAFNYVKRKQRARVQYRSEGASRYPRAIAGRHCAATAGENSLRCARAAAEQNEEILAGENAPARIRKGG